MLISCQHQYTNWYSMTQTWRSLYQTSYRLALTLMTVKIVGTCKLYLVHPDTKKLIETIFYVTTQDGSVLLSCKSTLTLDLIQPRSRLDNLPPRASLITSAQDHSKKTKQVQAPVQINSSKQLSTQSQPKEETSITSNVQDSLQVPAIKQLKSHKMITSKEQIIRQCPDVFDGIGKFLCPPYTIHLDPSIQTKQTPCRPVPIHLKEAFKKEIGKMLQAGVLKPVTEATPWINSFVLVESKDKSEKHKHSWQFSTNFSNWTFRPGQYTLI